LQLTQLREKLAFSLTEYIFVCFLYGGIGRAKTLALNLGQVRQPTGAPVDKKEGVSQCSVELLVAPLAT